jgi:hypothetical protein
MLSDNSGSDNTLKPNSPKRLFYTITVLGLELLNSSNYLKSKLF